jgi:HPt (histidine-containing phosphotransfer) domain-containing protein
VDGFTEHLSKPIRKAELLAALARHCALPASPPEDDDASLVRAIRARAPKYLASRMSDLALIPNALAEQDFNRIRIIGHNMTGSGSSFGFPAISMVGQRLEQAASAHDEVGVRAVYVEAQRTVELALNKLTADPVSQASQAS